MVVSNRYLYEYILHDLTKKMVFIGGPRQIGKTTLALTAIGAKDKSCPAYLNLDFLQDRKRLRQCCFLTGHCSALASGCGPVLSLDTGMGDRS